MGPFSRYAHPSFDHLDDWREFVTQLATRFDPVGFEIGNEENTNTSGTPPRRTSHPPPGYTRLYCAASEAIHGVRPTERVGVGGLAPIIETVLNPRDTSDKRFQASQFLRRAFEEGRGDGACRVDFVGYHPYLTRSYCRANPNVARPLLSRSWSGCAGRPGRRRHADRERLDRPALQQLRGEAELQHVAPARSRGPRSGSNASRMPR
jgi:hypothetical protein